MHASVRASVRVSECGRASVRGGYDHASDDETFREKMTASTRNR